MPRNRAGRQEGKGKEKETGECFDAKGFTKRFALASASLNVGDAPNAEEFFEIHRVTNERAGRRIVDS